MYNIKSTLICWSQCNEAKKSVHVSNQSPVGTTITIDHKLTTSTPSILCLSFHYFSAFPCLITVSLDQTEGSDDWPLIRSPPHWRDDSFISWSRVTEPTVIHLHSGSWFVRDSLSSSDLFTLPLRLQTPQRSVRAVNCTNQSSGFSGVDRSFFFGLRLMTDGLILAWIINTKNFKYITLCRRNHRKKRRCSMRWCVVCILYHVSSIC